MENLTKFRQTLSALRRSFARTTKVPADCRAVVSAENLESRILFALSSASGGSGLSANLSSNPVIRHQQLICDPAPAPAAGSPSVNLNPSLAPVAGALSVSYDPTKVTLIDVEPGPGYSIDYNDSTIAVEPGEGPPTDSLSNYLYYVNMGPPAETGDVDIKFSLTTPSAAGIQPLAPGYSELQEAGPIGFDTCVVTFALLPNVPQSSPKYTVFADPNAISGQPDFLQQSSAAGGQTVVAGNPNPITPASVGGAPQGLSVGPDASNPTANDLIINDNAPSANDVVLVQPAGRSLNGRTGISVQAILNGVHYNQTYTQAFSAVFVYLQDGNDTVLFNPFLTLNAFVTAGKGNDNVSLASGNNTVTLGNGNDNVLAIGPSNTVAAGDGNDNLILGNILLSNVTNSVSLGNGRDNILAVGSSTSVNAGDGNDNVLLGNGSNSVDLGNGNDNVVMGNGSNQYVYLGDGNDNVIMGQGSGQTITVGNGNDNVYLGNGSNDYVSVGSGNDVIDIGDGSNNSVYYAGSRIPKVKFGKGSNNTVQL